MWYLEYLFVFTLLLTPLFIWLKRPSGQHLLGYLNRFSMRSGAIYLWAMPTALLSIMVDPFGVVKPAPSEAFLRLVMFPLYLIYGYLIFADSGIQQSIIRQRRTSLTLALVGSIIPPIVALGLTQWGWKFNLPTYVLVMSVASLLIWSYLLAAFGYGMLYLNVYRSSLAYANEAILPFYILHQPVILVLGYFIIPLQLPILAKYLIITPLAFAITLGLFEYGVRRINLVRQIFGLKPYHLPFSGSNPVPQPLSDRKAMEKI